MHESRLTIICICSRFMSRWLATASGCMLSF